DVRPVAQQLAGKRDVGEAVTDVADPELAGEGRQEAGFAERRGQPGRRVMDGDLLVVGYVEDLPAGAPGLESEHAAPRDVADMDEVAPLEPVLEDHRRPVVEAAGGEDGEYARIGVRKRLAGAVDVEEAQP